MENLRSSFDNHDANEALSQLQIDKTIEQDVLSMQLEQAAFLKATAIHQASMEKHTASLLALKSQRNTLAPISRLPPEIFCIIFTWVRDSDSEELIYTMSGHPLRSALTWVNVTYVCRHWRNIALNSPNLWTRLSFKNILWPTTMMQRSKTAPLTMTFFIRNIVNYDFPDEYLWGLYLAFEHNSERIQHLSICIDERWLHVMDAELSKPTPQLESLCLSCAAVPSHLNDNPLPAVSPHFEPGAVGYRLVTESPKLRSLEFSHFIVEWPSDSLFMRPLTHLKLRSCLPAAELPWTWFVDMLKAMPLLEVLDLDDSFPIYTIEETATSSYGIANLGHLRELTVRCKPHELRTFLSRITFPPTAVVKIECRGINVDFSNAFKSLARLYSNMVPKPNFQTLIMLPNLHLPGASIKLFKRTMTDEQMLYAHSDDVVAALEVTYIWSSRYESSVHAVASQAANDLFSSVNLQDVKRVYMKDEIDGFKARTLAKTVGNLSQLTHFMAGKNASRVLVDAMKCFRNIKPANEFDFYFPRLESISFYGTSFHAATSFTRTYPADFDSDHLPVERLIFCIDSRRSNGASEIRKISLKRCRKLYEDDVSSIEEATHGTVDWDREVLESDSEESEEVM